MLEPEMEIESDLGIDSIKKVEIISELEREIPEGNGLSTDHMGTVKTLGDICKAIEPEKLPQDKIFVPVETTTDSSNLQDSNLHDSSSNNSLSPKSLDTSGKIFSVLVDAISELTGFPVEMLEPDMNLESDLGIDSIKRVEILSKLEQELEGVNTLSSEDMAGLKNIQDIVNFLTPDSPDISTISNADSDTESEIENNNKKKLQSLPGMKI